MDPWGCPYNILLLLPRLQDAFLDANVVAYNALITACVRGEEWQVALQVFGEALKSQLQLNVVTYSSALKLSGKP